MGPIKIVEKFINSGLESIEVTKETSYHNISQMLENDRLRKKERFKGIKAVRKDERVYLINLNRVDMRKAS